MLIVRTHVALLRGINVGGHNRLAMSDLRGIVTALGFGDVATYIQSGNVVLSSSEADSTRLSVTLEQAIADRSDVRPSVVVLSRPQLRSVVADNPYPEETNPKCLHVVFHRERISPEAVDAVTAAERRARSKGSRDEAAVIGSSLYMRTPDGLGRSVLAAQLARPQGAPTTDVVSTMRNWATITKMMARRLTRKAQSAGRPLDIPSASRHEPSWKPRQGVRGRGGPMPPRGCQPSPTSWTRSAASRPAKSAPLRVSRCRPWRTAVAAICRSRRRGRGLRPDTRTRVASVP